MVDTTIYLAVGRTTYRLVPGLDSSRDRSPHGALSVWCACAYTVCLGRVLYCMHADVYAGICVCRCVYPGCVRRNTLYAVLWSVRSCSFSVDPARTSIETSEDECTNARQPTYATKSCTNLEDGRQNECASRLQHTIRMNKTCGNSPDMESTAVRPVCRCAHNRQKM